MAKTVRKATVNKESIDYQLGTIITRLDGLTELTSNNGQKIGELTDKIGDLPCSNHDLRLEGLETKRQNKLTFKQGLIVAIIASLVSTGSYILLGVVI